MWKSPISYCYHRETQKLHPLNLSHDLSQTIHATPNDVAPFSTENPGNFHDDSYLSIASKLAEEPVREKVISTSFHTVRDLLVHTENNPDNDTVIPNKYSNVRMSVMCAIPSEDIDEDEAPIKAIRKMNQMIKV